MNHEKNKINWGIYNFQVTFEDEDVTHLQDPDTGEINKVKSEDKKKLDRGLIMSSPRDGLSTPYR